MIASNLELSYLYSTTVSPIHPLEHNRRLPAKGEKRIQKGKLYLRLLNCEFTEVISHVSYIQLKEQCIGAEEKAQPPEANVTEM